MEPRHPMSVADEHVVYGGPHGLGWEKLDRSKLCQTELCSTGLKRPPQGAVFFARNERAPGLPPGPLSLSLFGHLAIWPFGDLAIWQFERGSAALCRHQRAAAEVDHGLIARGGDFVEALGADEVGGGGGAGGDGGVDEGLGGDAADLGPLGVVADAAPDAEEGLVRRGALPLDGDGAVGVGVGDDVGRGGGWAAGGGHGRRRDRGGLVHRVGVCLRVGVGLDESQGVAAEVGHGVDGAALADGGVLGGDACGLRGVVGDAGILDGGIQGQALAGRKPDLGWRSRPGRDALLEPLDAVVDLLWKNGHGPPLSGILIRPDRDTPDTVDHGDRIGRGAT